VLLKTGRLVHLNGRAGRAERNAGVGGDRVDAGQLQTDELGGFAYLGD
jgi:hypothetical protein